VLILHGQSSGRYSQSVATIVIDSGFSSINAPFSVYRDSSLEIANPVRAISLSVLVSDILLFPPFLGEMNCKISEVEARSWCA
jgi:hypothetical protein